jgi:hypothetical protein
VVGRVDFIDGEPQARFSVPLRRLIGKPRFVSPLAIPAKDSAGGYISYLPMPFAQGLRVSVDGGAVPHFFYHIWHHAYPRGVQLDSWTGDEDLSVLAEQWSSEVADRPAGRQVHERANLRLAAGEVGEIFVMTGGGVIVGLRMKLPQDDRQLRSLWLLGFWDDDEKPSIEAPLSLFFAVENRYSPKPAAVITRR